MSFEKLSADVLRAHKGTSFPGVSTVFWCHDGTGNLFMAKRSQKARDERGTWEPGAGGLKWGQSLEGNLRRELLEEYGAEALEVEFIGYRDVFRELEDGTPTHWVGLDFLVLVDPAQVEIREPEMFDDAGWFTLDALPSPLHSQVSVALERHGDELRKKLTVKA